jgi:hypothetical protein
VESSLFATNSENREFRRSWKLAKEGLFPPRQIDEILRIFRPSEKDVLGIVFFLTKHQRLLPVLAEARGQIGRLFGSAQAYLELERDPDEGVQELFCVIPTTMDAKESLDRLRNLDEHWFLNKDLYTRFYLNITVRPTKDDVPVE